MTFSFYCEQWNKKLSEQYQLHLYFSIIMPWRLISCWWFLVVLKNFFLFILIFLAISVLFVNLNAFINYSFTFLFCHFQNNPSNCCCKSFEDHLFTYLALLRSQRYMQTRYVSILGRIASFTFPWRGAKELLTCRYRKSSQGEAGSGVPCLSHRQHGARLSEHRGSAGGEGWPYHVLCLTAPRCSRLSEQLVAWVFIS